MNSLGLKEENIWGHLKRCKFILWAIKSHCTQNKNYKMKILDIGCGTGELITLPLAEKGYNITGIDNDKNSIKRATAVNIFENATFLCEDLQRFSPSEKYDVIILSEVLEHLKKPEEALLTIRKFMKENAILVITIPNGFGPFEMEKLLLNKTGLRKALGLINNYKRKGNKKNENFLKMTENVQCEHVQFFKLDKFEKLVSTCDLKIITMGKSSFLAGPVSNWLF